MVKRQNHAKKGIYFRKTISYKYHNSVCSEVIYTFNIILAYSKRLRSDFLETLIRINYMFFKTNEKRSF